MSKESWFFGVQIEPPGRRAVKSLGRRKECTGKKAGVSFTCDCKC